MYIVIYKHHPAASPTVTQGAEWDQTTFPTLDDARAKARHYLRTHQNRAESFYIVRVEEVAAWSDTIDITRVN